MKTLFLSAAILTAALAAEAATTIRGSDLPQATSIDDSNFLFAITAPGDTNAGTKIISHSNFYRTGVSPRVLEKTNGSAAGATLYTPTIVGPATLNGSLSATGTVTVGTLNATNPNFRPGTGTALDVWSLTNSATGQGAWLTRPVYVPPIEDHFVGGIATSGQVGDLGWRFVGTVTASSSAMNQPGLYSVASGAGVTNLGSLYLGDGNASFTQGTNNFWTNAYSWKPSGAADWVNSVIRVGLSSGHLQQFEPLDAMVLVVSNTASAGVFSVCNYTGGVLTRVATAVTVTHLTWYTLLIESTGNGLITYRLNGVAYGPVAGGPANFIGTRPVFQIVNTLGEAAKSIAVDYWGLRPAPYYF